ncbi:agamous-like MADS-box protein AGL19 [Carica papaya]|uniref:agamous-like MADS-box protein AGL19 n=1 Tax=Carica papaya TaxID=3649 RepID=UPI000B8CF314|nr:agamous-like MADS-box protein AGL19 [Carica papaya]
MTKKIDELEISQRKLLGNELEPCSVDELQSLETQLERSLSKIRTKKNQLYLDEIKKLKEEEKLLVEENKKLREKCGLQLLTGEAKNPEEMRKQSLDQQVETELSIGLPKRLNTKNP